MLQPQRWQTPAARVTTGRSPPPRGGAALRPDSPREAGSSKTCRSRGIWHIGEACTELGIPPFTNHGLRRRAIRRFRKAGVPVKEAAAYFGHSEIVMLRMYDEIEEGDLEAAVAKVYGPIA